MILMALLFLSWLSSSFSNPGGQNGGQGGRHGSMQGPYVKKAAVQEAMDSTRVLSRYDAHVQPVIHYEKPGISTTARRLVPTPVRQAPEPQYTIELEGI